MAEWEVSVINSACEVIQCLQENGGNHLNVNMNELCESTGRINGKLSFVFEGEMALTYVFVFWKKSVGLA